MKVLIVEDDPLVSTDLIDKLRTLSISTIEVCDSLLSAKKLVSVWGPDVAIVDIELRNGDSGIELGKWFDHRNTPYFYLSGKQDLSTFDLTKSTNATANLEKPISLATLRNALYHAIETSKSATPKLNGYLFISCNGGKQRIKVSDIVYIKAVRAYCEVYLLGEEKPILASMPMGKMVDKINSPEIVQIHRSYWVSINHIVGRKGNLLYMDSLLEPLDIGATYREVLSKIMDTD